MARKPAQGLGMPPPAISSAEGVLSADTHILCCASMNVISVFCGAHGLVSQLKRAQAERRTSQCAACGVSPCASATTVAVHLRPSTVAKLDAPQKRAHGLLRPRRRLAPSVFHQHLSVLCSGTRAVQFVSARQAAAGGATHAGSKEPLDHNPPTGCSVTCAPSAPWHTKRRAACPCHCHCTPLPEHTAGFLIRFEGEIGHPKSAACMSSAWDPWRLDVPSTWTPAAHFAPNLHFPCSAGHPAAKHGRQSVKPLQYFVSRRGATAS